jgi:hypothetical protein
MNTRIDPYSSAFVCGLFYFGRRDEAGAVTVVVRFPDRDDLIDGDVAVLPFVIAQVQHARFHLQHFTTYARRAAAVEIELLPDKS